MKDFPDWFFDKTSWQETTLGNVSEPLIYGLNAKAVDFDGVHKYLRITDIDDKTRKFIQKDLVSPDVDNFDKKFLAVEGDIFFARTGSVGKTYIYKNSDGEIYHAGYLIRARIKKEFEPYFIFLQTLTNKYKNWIKLMSARSVQPGINSEEYRSFKFILPPLAVQKKIADYFTSLDNAINAQDLKLNSWRDAKKALLQKIFSQEFYFTTDNGEKYPAWQEKTLGEVAEFLQGLTYSPENISDDGIIVFRSSNIQNDSIDYSDVVKVDIDKKFLPKLQENDVLMCVRNGSKNLVGKTALIEKRDLGNTWGAFMMIIRSKEKNNFLYQYFKTNLFSKAIYKDIGTTTVNQITKGMLNNLKIKLPCLEEQKKIAEYFGSLDKIIDAESKMLESLRLMKRGLLQKLLV